MRLGLFVIGALLTAICVGSSQLGKPTETHRVLYPDGTLQLECPLDSSGQLHGELKMYYPSGRLKSTTDYYRGHIGRGMTYYTDDSD